LIAAQQRQQSSDDLAESVVHDNGNIHDAESVSAAAGVTADTIIVMDLDSSTLRNNGGE